MRSRTKERIRKNGDGEKKNRQGNMRYTKKRTTEKRVREKSTKR